MHRHAQTHERTRFDTGLCVVVAGVVVVAARVVACLPDLFIDCQGLRQELIVPSPCRSVVPSSFRYVAVWPEAGELVISILNPHEGRKNRKGGEKTRRKTTTNALHRWKTENGKWQMENGKCVSDNCKQAEASSFSVRLSLSLSFFG